ncbi:hypothetical protein Sru01_20180 [Sphaerisporangium rufum]|uniref:Phenylacetate-CoA ligase n=1 Tax=Sphaerisporangium rufum TaxID=1381558 RepID=A0A919UXI2_9ACTN|nr:hypothetical protein [Sphaerisporangium rufum]GII77036.1 hypothetical protein Sru01_20180 [Sphaerisporangium rufum]
MTMTNPGVAAAAEPAARLITDEELRPRSVDEVTRLPSFAGKLEEYGRRTGVPYCQAPLEVQNALVFRRLRQLVGIALLNPLWRERLHYFGIRDAPADLAEWERIPLSDKAVQRDMFMGTRAGMVVPIDRGGFEVVASGGTGDGMPLEIVYSLRELRDTYRIAGAFMGAYQLGRYLRGPAPRWLFTTLADYQMWSSGTMVGGVLSHVPGVNYIGAGPVSAPVLEHMFSYPGPKALMGITAGIALLPELGAGLSPQARASFRVAMYGSGSLPRRKRDELREFFPNVSILSYFAATQAECVGLQLDHTSQALSAVPGLHLVEIVDEHGRAVAEGEEGELVVTRLHADETPLLRLKLGDRMIRRPALDGPGLRTERFEFAGRTADVLHLNDSQYSATLAYAALRGRLRAATGVDLDVAAHEVQFHNHREDRTLTLLAAVDDAEGTTAAVEQALGQGGTRELFTKALPDSLSLFNDREANAASIEQTGYGFRLVFVPRSSPRIERTAVGKTPLVRDRG